MRKEQAQPVITEHQVFPGPVGESAVTVSDKQVAIHHDERLAKNINHANSGMIIIGQGPKVR